MQPSWIKINYFFYVITEEAKITHTFQVTLRFSVDHRFHFHFSHATCSPTAQGIRSKKWA